jgi:hypothetical protein
MRRERIISDWDLDCGGVCSSAILLCSVFYDVLKVTTV